MGIIDIQTSPNIRLKTPFVGASPAHVSPFICKNNPFVETKRFCAGFTLIELIVTLTVLGILIAIGVPAFGIFTRSNQLATTTNVLVGHLQLARSEAVKRSEPTVVCKSNDGATCTVGGTWASGWIVFVDSDNSGTWTQTAGDEDVLLQVHEALAGDTNVTPNPNSSAVIYSRQGLLTAGAGDYTICNTNLDKARVIEVNSMGRTHVTEASC